MKRMASYFSYLASFATSLSLAAPLSFAGSPSVDSDNSAQQESPVEEPTLLPEFSMSDVTRLKLAGGNYWMGYFLYTIDLLNGQMGASWNVFDCTLKHYEADVKLSDEDVKAIREAAEKLQYEVLEKDYECFLMADGDESRLTIERGGDSKGLLPFYPMKSYASRCQGKPLSDDSYKNLEDVVFKILPQPMDLSLYTAFYPGKSCGH